MRADLWRRKLLFKTKTKTKTKTQPANSSSGHRGYEWHNTEVDGQMHSRDAKIVDLVGEYLQTKEKNHNGRGRVGVGSRKRKGEEEGVDLLPPPLRYVF
jgi:hypothetical protein